MARREHSDSTNTTDRSSAAEEAAELVREQMPGMKVLSVTRAVPAPESAEVRPDASRSRPSPQAAADARREGSRPRGRNAVTDVLTESATSRSARRSETFFVTVQPEGLEGEGPAVRAESRRHVPVVGKRVVALPDSAGLPLDDELAGVYFPDPDEFRR